jgi:hypothetical protein
MRSRQPLDLSERLLHLNGTIGQMSGQADASTNSDPPKAVPQGLRGEPQRIGSRPNS